MFVSLDSEILKPREYFRKAAKRGIAEINLVKRNATGQPAKNG
jgi:hypothetical protein